MSHTIRVHLFGKATVFDHCKSTINLPAKAEELFFYLLVSGLNHQRSHEREVLCTLLWAEQYPERAKKYLRQTLWQLLSIFETKILDTKNPPEQSIIESDGNWIRLSDGAPLWSDAQQLVDVFDHVRDTNGADLTTAQVQEIKEAVTFYQGDLLTGWYQDWCILARERCQSMVLALLDKLVDRATSCRAYADGIDHAHRILQIDNAREQTHRALMRLHYLANDRSTALRQFEYCSRALTQELSVMPAKSTLELYEQIRADQLDQPSLSQSPPNSVRKGNHNYPEPQGTLTQIRDMLATMVQDIGSIKQAMDL